MSYSLYAEATSQWFREHAGTGWPELRRATLSLLQHDRELRDIAALIGSDALQDADRLVLDIARVIRDTVLGQSAYDPNDAWSPIEKTWVLANLAHEMLKGGGKALERGRSFDQLDLATPRRLLGEMRFAPAGELAVRAAAVRNAVAEMVR